MLTGLAMVMLSTLAMASEVDNMRLWAAPDHARLVFDLSAPAQAEVFTLENPRRLVIDIADSRLEANPSSLDLEGSAISEIRTGVRNGDDLRVVLDLSRDIVPRHFTLQPNAQYGHRLVVDLEYPGESAIKDPIDPIAAKIREQEIAAARARGKAAPAQPVGGQDKAQPHPKRDIIVAIDAGHGGEDPGAIGPHGTREKDVVLGIARRLEAIIDGTPGYSAVMIRDGDYYVGLRERTMLARKYKADFFVSIHADAFKSSRPSGSSVFALSLSGASSETAKWLATKENRADLIGGVDGSLDLADKDEVLRGVLLDLAMTATLNDSLTVGGRVLDQLAEINNLHKPRVEQAAFVVLKSPDIPSLLVETGFISNPEEERQLQDPGYQQRLAEAIFTGLNAHFRRNPPPDSLLAWQRDQGRGNTADEYRIQPGDTLSEIATRHQVPISTLRQANELNGDVIRVGQVLRIPQG
ncbi:N-acetylmuramoyl-L-alanine amidase [Modicisalibacter muralis]|uniref:N-acetylmuramoyl-L-alanine amidase AmiC n=2 Tax=Modicisalibacter muralis TaxID=119000 RepID=A0A1G9PRU8_9GAMM|nr:N-acetylmuramoyl-L-alanine amidase [Halomonas muralis]SDM01171.1 N-acetylmuramoyl-L-alanine amidase [Halomonas muralis]